MLLEPYERSYEHISRHHSFIRHVEAHILTHVPFQNMISLDYQRSHTVVRNNLLSPVPDLGD